MAKNRVAELQVQIASINEAQGVGALPVANVGINGSVATYTLVANAAAGSGDAATEFVSSATGFKAFKLQMVSDVAIEADKLLMVGWSTTATAQAAVTTVLDALRTALGTPDGAGHSNVMVFCNPADLPWIYWDGTTTIKTISVASQGTDNYDVALITVA